MTQAAGSTVVAGFRTYSGAEGKPVAQRSAKTGTAGSTLCWLFTTLEGTVDVQTDAATGATVQSYRDPFGVPVGSSAQGWADSGGYLNKQVAAGTGLTNVGARTYDPVLGKFLSVDPVIDTNLPQQNTGYTYSGNNPTTYNDPSGLRFAIIAAEATGGKLTKPKKPASGAPTTKPSPMPGIDPNKYMSIEISREKARQAEKQREVLLGQTRYLLKEHKEALTRLLYASNSEEYRVTHNKGPNSVAKDLIHAYGAKCTIASNGLNVCYSAGWPARGGTTFGEYFITNQNVERVLKNSELLAHEQAHSAQWAAFGEEYPFLYMRFELESSRANLPAACGNIFESSAGLDSGGYGC